MSRKYFGTDGVRGPYGSATMNEAFAWRLGAAAAHFIKTLPRSVGGPLVLIGRDTRASGASLERALASGLRAAGLEPTSLGVVPTPDIPEAHTLASNAAAALRQVIGPPPEVPAWPA